MTIARSGFCRSFPRLTTADTRALCRNALNSLEDLPRHQSSPKVDEQNAANADNSSSSSPEWVTGTARGVLLSRQLKLRCSTYTQMLIECVYIYDVQTPTRPHTHSDIYTCTYTNMYARTNYTGPNGITPYVALTHSTMPHSVAYRSPADASKEHKGAATGEGGDQQASGSTELEALCLGLDQLLAGSHGQQ